MQFHTIVTHESPDLDALLCCYLLHTYGEPRYPGIQKAQIRFYPAGNLPDNKTPDQLEQEGILVVDMGGGRLDTHPSGNALQKNKLFLSAANLVAADLGIAEKGSLKNLLEFVRLHDSTGKSLSSRNPVDHLMSLPTLVRGGLLHFGHDFTGMTRLFANIFHAIETANDDDSEEHRKLKNSYLIGSKGDCFFIPSTFSLKSFCSGYIADRIMKKKLLWEESASDLDNKWENLTNFSESFKLYDYPELQKLLFFLDRLKPSNYLLDSNTPIDQTISLINIIKGFCLLYQGRIEQVKEAVFLLLDCVLAYEREWNDAVSEYQKKRQLYVVGSIRLAVISATSGVATKAARWLDKPDVILFQDTNEFNISISLNQLGRLKNYTLTSLCARIRAAELFFDESQPGGLLRGDLSVVGEMAGWFLHQSEKLLVHGSPKSRRSPTKIPLLVLVEIVLSEFDKKHKLPNEICPNDRCLQRECVFFGLQLENCFLHRENLRCRNEAAQKHIPEATKI